LTYNLDYAGSCKEDIEKRTRKNSELKRALERQIAKILANPRQGKPLHSPLEGKWRVHVLSVFVLTYEISEETKTVLLKRFTHHDEAY